MSLSLTWLDHDSDARDRALRILALFEEKDTRDELGLGSVRDAFADQLFPGTSTIQTRLRYFFFIPWIYQQLEDGRISATEVESVARRREVELISPLLESDDQSGVFGRVAGGSVQRLPSSVYWSGLRSWGVFQKAWSQAEYHNQISKLRDARRRAAQQRAHRRDHLEDDTPDELDTWHPQLPDPPAGFPDINSFKLTRLEADFLLDRIKMSHPDSLFAWLAIHASTRSVNRSCLFSLGL